VNFKAGQKGTGGKYPRSHLQMKHTRWFKSSRVRRRRFIGEEKRAHAKGKLAGLQNVWGTCAANLKTRRKLGPEDVAIEVGGGKRLHERGKNWAEKKKRHLRKGDVARAANPRISESARR